MRVSSHRVDPDPRAAAQEFGDLSVRPIPAPVREEKRLFIRRARDRMNPFAIRLKACVRWIKQFLHGAK